MTPTEPDPAQRAAEEIQQIMETRRLEPEFRDWLMRDSEYLALACDHLLMMRRELDFTIEWTRDWIKAARCLLDSEEALSRDV